MEYILKAMWMTFFFYWWGNSVICYRGSYHTVKTRHDKVGLSVNPNETGLVITRRRKLPDLIGQHFLVVSLHHSMLVKCLGVVLDSWLIWRGHVDVKVRKAHNLLWACRKAYGATWGLRPTFVHWLYVSIIRPSIPFASFIWWPACQRASAKKD